MSATIFVRGFDFGTPVEDVEAHCQSVGDVIKIALQGKGAAIVTYASSDEANFAVEELNNTVIEGNTRYLDVKIDEKQGSAPAKSVIRPTVKQGIVPTPVKTAAKRPAPRSARAPANNGGKDTVYVRGFDFGTTEEMLEGHCSLVGEVVSVKMRGKGSAYVTYSSPEEAEEALLSLDKTTIDGNDRFIDVVSKQMESGGFVAKGGSNRYEEEDEYGEWDEEYDEYEEPPLKKPRVYPPVYRPVLTKPSKGTGSYGKGGKGKNGSKGAMLALRPDASPQKSKGKGVARPVRPSRKEDVHNSHRIFVRGFDFGTTDEQVYEHFSAVGKILDVRWCTKGSALISYGSAKEASAAVHTLHETVIEGNSRYVDVMFRDP
eukprot:TRINITY_DN46240_c0_g1_i1.p1 TRINITY_DN46240_c0_g1~~TRINITY_DN46240_c0_g1_i1.p1  ORF type:complete len:399 (-),score=70.83 TRINITY_DN46240_c0_g1_i1:96-1217(-)